MRQGTRAPVEVTTLAVFLAVWLILAAGAAAFTAVYGAFVQGIMGAALLYAALQASTEVHRPAAGSRAGYDCGSRAEAALAAQLRADLVHQRQANTELRARGRREHHPGAEGRRRGDPSARPRPAASRIVARNEVAP